MRRVLKILGGIALVLVVGIAVLIGWLAAKKPAMRVPSAEKIEATPERLARGKYLVENVTHCLGCHSDAFFDRFAIPTRPGTEGQGGFVFDKKLSVPGVVQAQNITSDPTNGIGGWTDGEVMRAIREGVNRDGEAMFPMMPYPNYRALLRRGYEVDRGLPADASADRSRGRAAQARFPGELRGQVHSGASRRAGARA